MKYQILTVGCGFCAFIAWDLLGLWGFAVMAVAAVVFATLRYAPKKEKPYAVSPLSKPHPLLSEPIVVNVPMYLPRPRKRRTASVQPALDCLAAVATPPATADDNIMDAEWEPVNEPRREQSAVQTTLAGWRNTLYEYRVTIAIAALLVMVVLFRCIF